MRLAGFTVFSLSVHRFLSGRLPALSLPIVRFAIGAPLIFSGLLAVESRAAITFGNSVRTVSSSNNRNSMEAKTAPGMDPFNDSTRVDWQEFWAVSNTTGKYYSMAGQDSTISASSINAKGSAKGTGSFEFWGDPRFFQGSTSQFDVDFTIDSACTIFLTGMLDLFTDLGGTNRDYPEVRVTLSGQNGQVFSQYLNAFSGPDYQQLGINETFSSLEVGQYHLNVYARTSGSYDYGGVGGEGNASFDITLVPEPSAFLLAGLGGLLVLTRRVRPAR
jgi:hypothetical protein